LPSPIPDEIRLEILDRCSSDRSSVQLVSRLNFNLGALFAEAVKRVCSETGVKMDVLNFIVSHGQTVFRIPVSFDRYEKAP
jgi:anhydro-N-acetylmuramic acid kinase